MLTGFPLLLDGGMGSALINMGLQPGAAPELWLLEHPQRIESVHRSFIDAGCDIIQTASFGANRARLSHDEQLSGRAEDLCRRAAHLARAAVSSSRSRHKRKVLIAGNIGPALAWLGPAAAAGPAGGPSDPRAPSAPDQDLLHDIFGEAARALADAGVDLLSVETLCDVREARAAVRAARDTGLPVLASMTFRETCDGFESLAGDSLQRCLDVLTEAGASAVGLNCNLDSSRSRRLALDALSKTDRPLVVQPCAGQPVLQNGALNYPEQAQTFLVNQLSLVQAGVAIVGGCCGTSAAALMALRRGLDNLDSGSSSQHAAPPARR